MSSSVALTKGRTENGPAEAAKGMTSDVRLIFSAMVEDGAPQAQKTPRPKIGRGAMGSNQSLIEIIPHPERGG